ncbi:unnamed protein product [Clonostachys rosea f. rosea IK726]|uniref:RBR-type E3 ubiquitin transferase n=2 Tax=Bionectria ochroleuca TaxID=29856 RepID=A0A0B7JL71_BIOOC|nr:unnamed protein product [Clonostachys rosea f. rosea IK726]
MAAFPGLGEKKIMPGTYEPTDFEDLESNPFELLTQFQDEWRNRERPDAWSTKNLTALDLTDVDWQAYNPPASVFNLSGVDSQLLAKIIHTSVENVNARSAHERGQRLEIEELRAAAEKQAAQKPKEIEYLPIIIPPERPEPSDVDSIAGSENASIARMQAINALNDGGRRPSQASSMTDPSSKSIKGRKGRFRKLLDRVGDFGETGSSGRLGLLPPLPPSDLVGENALPFPNSLQSGSRQGHRGSTIQELGATIRANIEMLQSRSTSIYELSSVIPVQELPGSTVMPRSKSVKHPPPPPAMVECVSCLEEFPPGNVVKVPCHSYCHECFAGLISAACRNEQQWPPKCCLNEIPFRTILRYVPKDLKQKFQDRSSEWNVPVNERIYCSTPDCSLWISPESIRKNANKARCERGHWTCTICRGPQHDRGECPQDRDMNLTNQLAEEEGWKRCYNCRALVEHKEACQHMTCRCGSQFCYVCGLRWKTCGCTMEQLKQVKDAAAARKEERQRKEAQESEELRQMLAEIAEFERQEALKAEMERQENIRLEELRQQQELLERVRLECIRRLEIEAKFLELRVALDRTHDRQVILLAEEQVEAEAKLAEDYEAAKVRLEQKQVEDRGQLEISIQTRISGKDEAFGQEFSVRSALETKILEEFHVQLLEYWKIRPNGEGEIEKAMALLRKTMEQYYQAWKEWRDRQQAAYSEQLEEERIIMGELVTSGNERLKEKHEESVRDMGRRKIAEKKWLRTIAAEREKLLAEAEEQEMEGEADTMFSSESRKRASANGERPVTAGPAPKEPLTMKPMTVRSALTASSPVSPRTHIGQAL